MEVGWHSRGYLPHFEGGERAQFVTFRLGDALPRNVVERWRQELLKSESSEAEAAFRKRIELYLDAGYGAAYMKDARIADVVERELLHGDGKRYRLTAWCVMPNHVHLLVVPYAEWTLSKIMQAIKTYSAREANKLLNRQGRFWMEDYFDRYIRDAEHFYKVKFYIENNPVKARLCHRAQDWRWSSAYANAGSADGSSAMSAEAQTQ